LVLLRLEEVTLSVRPVKLNKSIYLRVPNDIADLIDINQQGEVTLSFEQEDDRFLLIYSVRKQATVAAALTSSGSSHEGYDRVEIVSRPKHGRINT
jgi:hypothetical protein